MIVNIEDFVVKDKEHLPGVIYFNFEKILSLEDEDFMKFNFNLTEKYIKDFEKKNHWKGGNPCCFKCGKEISNIKDTIYLSDFFYDFNCFKTVYKKERKYNLKYQEHLKAFYDRVIQITKKDL